MRQWMVRGYGHTKITLQKRETICLVGLLSVANMRTKQLILSAQRRDRESFTF